MTTAKPDLVTVLRDELLELERQAAKVSAAITRATVRHGYDNVFWGTGLSRGTLQRWGKELPISKVLREAAENRDRWKEARTN